MSGPIRSAFTTNLILQFANQHAVLAARPAVLGAAEDTSFTAQWQITGARIKELATIISIPPPLHQPQRTVHPSRKYGFAHRF